MARPLRIEFAGALYHVTSRGNGRADIYLCSDDRKLYLSVLEEACRQFNWRVYAWCLMDNHYHLLIETPDANLSKGMRYLNGVYTQKFNRAHSRVGHLYQGRFKAILVEKEAYLMELSRYVVLNPVRAMMVERADQWIWSSYRMTAGLQVAPFWLDRVWLLEAFGQQEEVAIRNYMKFVADGVSQSSPWEMLKGQIYLGSDDFLDEAQSYIKQGGEEIPRAQRRAIPEPIKVYAEKSASRNAGIFAAYRKGGYTLKEIADYFSLHYSTISRIVSNEAQK